MKLENVATVTHRLKGIGRKIPKQARQAVRTEAELIMSDAKLNYVPRRSGALRSSGRVTQIGSNQFQATAEMSFSGPHSIAVHENPSKHDPPSWRGKGGVNFRIGGPKYLERPLRAAIPGMTTRLGKFIKF